MNQAKAAKDPSQTVVFEQKNGHTVCRHNGFIYTRTSKKVNQNGSVMWRCEHYRDTYHCKATCSTIGDQIIRHSNTHSCPILSTTDLIYKQAEREIINHIKKNPKSRPKPIFMNNINNATQKLNLPNGYTKEAAQRLPTWDKFRDRAYRAKRSEMPKAPKTRQDINLEGKYSKTNSNQNFVLFDTDDDDRIICFSSPHQQEILSNCTEWYVDGTFKSAPPGFAQLFIIHGWYNDEMYPCAWVALRNKTSGVYKKMLEQLIDKCEFEL